MLTRLLPSKHPERFERRVQFTGWKELHLENSSFDWKRKPVCVPCELIHSGISQLENTECLQNHPHADSYKDNADFYNAPGPVRVY